MKRRLLSIVSTLAALAALLVASRARACACGCSVFTVGQRWQMPIQSGFSAFFQYSFMDQSQNWHGSSSASAALNADQDIRTHFLTFGARYMFNRAWGVMARLPVWERYLRTTDATGRIVSAEHLSLSDATLMGLFTGLSDDMSTGLELGVKLPTGPHQLSGFDPDTQPGYGSTSLLVGAYHIDQETDWGWWAQALVRNALYAYQNYRPGNSYNVSIGAHYDALKNFHVVPSLNLIASIRSSDGGSAADPANTGFFRFFAAPGVEVLLWRGLNVYGEFEIPVYTYTHGYQLVAPWLVSATLSYDF